MNAVLRFSPALSDWVLHNLRQGCTPAQVVAAMRAQDMPPDAAKAIVDAFVFALRTGSPVPTDSVTVAPAYAVPAKRCAVTVVTPSDEEVPLSVAAVRAGAGGAEGATRSILTVQASEGHRSPRASVA